MLDKGCLDRKKVVFLTPFFCDKKSVTKSIGPERRPFCQWADHRTSVNHHDGNIFTERDGEKDTFARMFTPVKALHRRNVFLPRRFSIHMFTEMLLIDLKSQRLAVGSIAPFNRPSCSPTRSDVWHLPLEPDWPVHESLLHLRNRCRVDSLVLQSHRRARRDLFAFFPQVNVQTNPNGETCFICRSTPVRPVILMSRCIDHDQMFLCRVEQRTFFFVDLPPMGTTKTKIHASTFHLRLDLSPSVNNREGFLHRSLIFPPRRDQKSFHSPSLFVLPLSLSTVHPNSNPNGFAESSASSFGCSPLDLETTLR